MPFFYLHFWFKSIKMWNRIAWIIIMYTQKDGLKSNCTKSAAFTLAEVLIVLGIIGIVAQMTIPTLMQSVKEQSTIGSLKKTYSTFSSAYTSALQENGPITQWDIGTGAGSADPAGSIKLLNYFAPYLKIIQKCDTGTGCFSDDTVRYLNGTGWMNFNTYPGAAKAILADGSTIWLYTYGSCNYDLTSSTGLKSCGCLMLDTNGMKKPNQEGMDIFVFEVATTAILPTGMANDTSAGGNFNDNCRDKATTNGAGCAAWVIYNGNMDYLKCNDLSWTGKTTCN